MVYFINHQLTLNGSWEGRGQIHLAVAVIHEAVEPGQGHIGGVGGLLDKDVASRDHAGDDDIVDDLLMQVNLAEGVENS